MKFAEFIQPQAIVPSLDAADRDGAIHELVQSLAAAGAIEAGDAKPIYESLVERERLGTTGFGYGVAAPHCKHPLVKRLVGTIGISSRGIAFPSLDGKPVHCLFVLLCPAGQDALHSQAMEVIFRNLQQPQFRKMLRTSETREAIVGLLDEVDGK